MKEGRRPVADGSSSHQLGDFKLKAKSKQELRQQTGEITEDRAESRQKNSTQFESYMLFLFLTVCLSFATFSLLFSPICNYFQIIYFPCFCPFPSICSYFILFSAPSLPYLPSLFQCPFPFLSSPRSFRLSDTEFFPPSLSQPMAVSMSTQSGREGIMYLLHFQSLTYRWVDRKCH